MIEVKRPPPEPPRYSDPEEPLAGKCMTCGTVVGCLRMDAKAGTDRSAPGQWDNSGGLGSWSDLISAECPNCGARVFVMPAVEFQKVIAQGPQE